MTVAIEVVDLCKRFAETVALDGVSFEVPDGEVLSLLGPSGCGKTTTLRSIAGLETPDDGIIRIGGAEVVRKGRNVPPEERGLSMVFQQYALWPHLDVKGNVMFGPLMRHKGKAEAHERAKRALEMVKLWHQRDRRIAQLSGGQQQRVALARALALEPKVVLLDEPLSNLDAKLREETKLELMELQRALGFTAVYVTHDQGEALSLSDQIVILNDGRIEQIGAPEEIWSDPASRFVAEFIGDSNTFDGVLEPTRPGEPGLVLRTTSGMRLVTNLRGPFGPGDEITAFVAFDDVVITETGDTARHNVVAGHVRLTSFQGYSSLAMIEVGDVVVTARVPSRSRLREGAAVSVGIPPDAMKCFGVHNGRQAVDGTVAAVG
ncbi:ABC transporter ATP-binding protein [Actinophytocola sp.]|uniref:ABC transporter ATP-binding protein n=1 Tax=Actinophytocola sp. TaxID=1872138 RepID=UPI003D6C38B1